MRASFLVLCVGLVSCAGLVLCAGLGRGPAAAGGTIELFDGESLRGWVDGNGKPVEKGWHVDDGMLICQGKAGSIYTAKEYGDFELTFRWRISKRGNSGVKYRVRHYDHGVFGHPGWLGCEYQMIDDGGSPTPSKHSCAALYELYPPKKDRKVRPLDEFNDSRIVARGDHLEHWLNGELVVQAQRNSDEWKKRISESKFGPIDGIFQNDRGRIMLQDHGSKTWFSRVTLRVLEEE